MAATGVAHSTVRRMLTGPRTRSPCVRHQSLLRAHIYVRHLVHSANGPIHFRNDTIRKVEGRRSGTGCAAALSTHNIVQHHAKGEPASPYDVRMVAVTVTLDHKSRNVMETPMLLTIFAIVIALEVVCEIHRRVEQDVPALTCKQQNRSDEYPRH